jgi:deoxyribose-phosphate aldolase
VDQDFDNGFFDAEAFAAKTLANWQTLASVIDHTLLKPEATREQIENLCDEAIRYRFAAVVGFPLGASLASTLRHEAAALIRLGVRELDMVLPIGQLKSGNHLAVQNTIHAVAAIAHEHEALLKVILETALLTVEEKLRAAEIAILAGADFIKTSTGFSSGGATAADVALMRGVAGSRCGVKAAGGIRTLADADALLRAGATRIGASASVAMVRELGAE